MARIRYRELWHATHIDNLPSICRNGILIKYAQTALPRIWLCTLQRKDWALMHCAARHKWLFSEVVFVRAKVRADLLHACKAGLFWTKEDIIRLTGIDF